MRRIANLPNGSWAGAAGAAQGHHATTGMSGSKKGVTTLSAWSASGPDSRSTTTSPAPASPPTRTWASSRASAASALPGVTTMTRLGCSWLAALAASIDSSSRVSLSDLMISVPTRPIVTTPALSRSSSSFLLTAVVVVSSMSTIMSAALPSWSPPFPAGPAQHLKCRRGPPGARFIGVGLAVCCPIIEDGIEYFPGQFDLLVHREQRWLTEQHIQDQSFVSLGRIFRERRAVGEVHVDVADFHRAARDLGTEPQGDPFVRLYPDDNGVGAELVGHGGVERQMGRAFEDQSDLGHPAAQSFPGSQVERHDGPAAGVHLERDGGECLGGGVLREALLVEQTDHFLAALPAGSVLATAAGLIERLRELGGRQHLDLLGLQRAGFEADRLFHRGEREQLHQVVLDDIAGGANAVVVAGPPAQSDVFGHGDLHMVHVVRVPDRIPQLVGEAQRQDILHRLLAQVVVDPEYRLLREDRVDHVVEITCALQVVAERLLDDDPAPSIVLRAGQPGLVQLFAHHRERLGRDRQVEGVVAADAALGVELLERLGQPPERVLVVELPAYEPQSIRQPLPDRLAKRGTAVPFDVIEYYLGESVVIPIAAGEAHQGEGRRQQAAVGQVVDGRHDLLMGQVAGDTEKHHGARAGDSGKSLIFFVPQRVMPLRGTSQSAHLAAESSCFCVSLSSSVQESTNFSTPSFSRTLNTSVKST